MGDKPREDQRVCGSDVPYAGRHVRQRYGAATIPFISSVRRRALWMQSSRRPQSNTVGCAFIVFVSEWASCQLMQQK